MSYNAIQLFLGRIEREEGSRLTPYDDATGKSVAAPVGNLSWGWGFNLTQCGSSGLFLAMATYLTTKLDQQLLRYPWYAELGTEPTRQSVFLDIAYNAGVNGLLHFPKMLAYAHARDWQNCAAECKVADARLDTSRYAPLRQLLINGDSHL